MQSVYQKFSIVMLLLVSVTGLSLLLGAVPVSAQSKPDPISESTTQQDDIATIKADLEEIKKELKSLRQFLVQRLSRPARSNAPVVAEVSLAGNPILGKKDAPITLIEFSDYQCPFCNRFFRTTLPTLKTEFIETGKVRYVFRDFPLDRIHPYARKAAEAAHCAGDQGKYWEMHDAMFQSQKALQVDKLKTYATNLKLDATAFNACLENGKYTAEVEKDYQDGTAAGVRGTPGFFIGKTRPGDTIQGALISGAQPFAVFRQTIEGLLKKK